METLEGLTPTSIWSFICIAFALIGVFIVIAKAIDIIRTWVKDHKAKKELGKKDIADDVADKVIDKLKPQIDEKFGEFETKMDEKFKDIDVKLAADKAELASHTRQLNAQNDRVDRLDYDSRALLHGVSALLGHQVDGNSIDKLQRTNDAMKNYLIDRKYDESDWK